MRVPGVDVSKGEGAGLAEPVVYFFGKAGRKKKGSVLETGGY